ncbi:metal/formaldehyde-sensitive transcriptional repressor [Ralstonia insidiosa]|jgi:DNA-binding FrmR family transcriptional regulator|uniref:metal/formaldehyde-sensitive transcriptional repressor n=1 Tax=Ralstonia TaxID=48736 RepID=UPI00066485FF|nr:metal/formaldehyde-sensitive transcriptional repressor [Ralstonia insidiosa]KMW45134.1 transcriptional repressor rcnR [Ralstonia sp. MD27]MBX3773196.1 metal/formaldehyde-sensitive transcriptional repressor [Ralstonia pickettii]NOZ14885.1 metal/formaldehyde-sensitive transcriptional repressor [Betaproteobacteria bacterium]MBA9858684.1 metal/formaldehyde-sensitive transcriptional repressor [Ralstonia insidiosa]MBA9872909.1 metal/formaldehyde-sensitive transcriptional repressor [Ralstonia insi
MAHTIRDKAKLLARVRRIQGQATALEKQLGEEGDCTAILQQIAAIRGAVNGLMAAVLEGHLMDHVVKEPTEAQRQEDFDAVMQVIKSYLK